MMPAVVCSWQMLLVVSVLVILRVECTQIGLKQSGFPPDARVRVIGGRETRIADLKPHEFVEYVDDAGGKRYTQVLMFTSHDAVEEHKNYLRIDFEDGRALTLTNGQYVDEERRAVEVSMGDRIRIADGEWSVVTSVERVTVRGVVGPQTSAGRIIVNSVAVSTYNDALRPEAAHAALAPIRAIAKARLSTMPIDKVGSAIDCFHKARHEGGLITTKRCFALPWSVPVRKDNTDSIRTSQ